jgi:RpiR family carbohydrate utilization transcriptional regulator
MVGQEQAGWESMSIFEGFMFDRIRNATEQMRPSERKVADYVLSQPEKAVSQGISAMAAESGVSDPTVLRFCRALGFDGFQDFKLGLAQSIAIGTAGIHQGIEPDDRAPTLATKICSQSINAINDLSKKVDWDQVERAIDVLAAAARIEFHGAGASGAVAIDAQHKFFRLNVPVVAYVDPHMQIMSAASLTCGDALVSFSYTGRAREVVNAARLAREREASVIAVTTAGTALAEIASHPICLPLIEDTEQYTPMTSRLLQLVVVDILEIGVSLRRGPSLSHHLRRLKEALLQARLEITPSKKI